MIANALKVNGTQSTNMRNVHNPKLLIKTIVYMTTDYVSDILH